MFGGTFCPGSRSGKRYGTFVPEPQPQVPHSSSPIYSLSQDKSWALRLVRSGECHKPQKGFQYLRGYSRLGTPKTKVEGGGRRLLHWGNGHVAEHLEKRSGPERSLLQQPRKGYSGKHRQGDGGKRL